MSVRSALTAFAILSGLVAPQAAQACSVVSDYRVPTNLELAADAQLILLGRVSGGDEGDGPFESAITVEPIEAVKGAMPPTPITIRGAYTIEETNERGYHVFSDPYELEEAHPLSYIGGCIRYMFPADTTALFFLERRDGEWRSAGGPFSRWAEDVLAEDAPWLRLTRFYTEVAAAPPESRVAMLEAERARLRSQENRVSQLMAEDIGRQLDGPNEPWNVIMQRAIESQDWGRIEKEDREAREGNAAQPDTMAEDIMTEDIDEE
ncbi:hypothetical protein AAG596_06795 [Citromicrobium bathyomarinum]|uniref:hypothetical protein n=1 Tax=Citromicrobium bathyomarinum TaxID=72174 RepID=UPI003159F78F